MSEYDNELREIDEALQAANVALNHLYEAKNKLSSASNWGIADILGGGLLITYVKRQKMKDASNEIKAAQRALGVFNRELKDVRHMEINIDMNGFLEFSDYAFDSLLTDVMTQSRISDAKADVDDAIVRVEDLIDQLEDRQEAIVDEMYP